MAASITKFGRTAVHTPTPSTLFEVEFCNIRGLHSNLNAVHHHLETARPALLFLTETQILPPADTGYLNYPGYVLEESFKAKAGVCLYVRADVCCRRLRCLEDPSFSMLGVHVDSGPRARVYVCLYRSHTGDVETTRLFEHLSRAADDAQERFPNAELVFLGDFNAHHNLWLSSSKTDHAGISAHTFALTHDLKQLVDQPTRIPDIPSQAPSLLDLLLTTHPQGYQVVVRAPLGSSDHCLISAKAPQAKPPRPAVVKRRIWHYGSADWDGFGEHLVHWFASLLSNRQVRPSVVLFQRPNQTIPPGVIRDFGRAAYAPLRESLPTYTELQTQLLLAQLNDPQLKQEDLLECSRAILSVAERTEGWISNAYNRAKKIAGIASYTYYISAVDSLITSISNLISMHSRRIETAFLSSISEGGSGGVLSASFPASLTLEAAASALLDVITARQELEARDEEPKDQHPLLDLPTFLLDNDVRQRLPTLRAEPWGSGAALRRAKEQLRGLGRAILRNPVDVQLDKIPQLPVWNNNDALSTDLPDFALSPQEYITETPLSQWALWASAQGPAIDRGPPQIKYKVPSSCLPYGLPSVMSRPVFPSGHFGQVPRAPRSIGASLRSNTMSLVPVKSPNGSHRGPIILICPGPIGQKRHWLCLICAMHDPLRG
ncbi:hypothetical protein evm_006936 [Chilo suppressalis]|nr:hypothetical protein evm_006936 [Chilo suppressalis]